MSTALRRSFVALPFFLVTSAAFALYTVHRDAPWPNNVEWAETAIRFFHWSRFEHEAQSWSEWNCYFYWEYPKLVLFAMAEGFLCWLALAAFITARKMNSPRAA